MRGVGALELAHNHPAAKKLLEDDDKTLDANSTAAFTKGDEWAKAELAKTGDVHEWGKGEINEFGWNAWTQRLAAWKQHMEDDESHLAFLIGCNIASEVELAQRVAEARDELLGLPELLGRAVVSFKHTTLWGATPPPPLSLGRRSTPKTSGAAKEEGERPAQAVASSE